MPHFGQAGLSVVLVIWVLLHSGLCPGEPRANALVALHLFYNLIRESQGVCFAVVRLFCGPRCRGYRAGLRYLLPSPALALLGIMGGTASHERSNVPELRDKDANREAFMAAWKPYDWSPPACPECGSKMKKRLGGRDQSAFWGCGYYPNCKTIVQPKRFTPQYGGDTLPDVDGELPF